MEEWKGGPALARTVKPGGPPSDSKSLTVNSALNWEMTVFLGIPTSGVDSDLILGWPFPISELLRLSLAEAKPQLP
jgi:hypothetical protein